MLIHSSVLLRNKTLSLAEGLFYRPQGSFSFTPSSDGKFGRPPYRTTDSNELRVLMGSVWPLRGVDGSLSKVGSSDSTW
jgi:hypothetical protein